MEIQERQRYGGALVHLLQLESQNAVVSVVYASVCKKITEKSSNTSSISKI